MAIKAIINNTEKEIEQIKNSDEQDVDYVYSRIGDTEVEGEPSISIKSIGGNLADYRIYGQTVDGESVGDRTGNLFDGFSIHGKVPSVSNGELVNSSSAGATTDLITIDTGDITLSKDVAAASNMYIFLYSQDKTYIGYTQTSSASTLTLKGSNINGYQNAKYARIRVDAETAYSQANIMLNTGSTPLPYEPYGYKVPVTVSNGADTLTTPIYLPEQIRKVGDEAEYIDYAEQKMHRIDADDIDVTLPALSTIKGTNTFSVNTTIQPSNIYIKDNFDYKKVFTATRVIEDELPLSYRSIEDNDSALSNYRIYGNTETLTRSYSGSAPLSFPIVDGAVSNYRVYGNTVGGESVGDRTGNILPMSTTPIDTIIDDFHCEYDGMGTIKLIALTNNAILSGFTVPLSKDFTIPISVGQGGTGCLQINNDAAYINVSGKAFFTLNLNENTYTRDFWRLHEINRINSNYTVMGGANINAVQIQTDPDAATNIKSGQTLTIRPAFVENVTERVPFEPYGYKIPVTNNSETANIYLDELLTKSGDNADYIDYAEQKRYNADGTSEDVTLPALPAQSSTNSLSVGTAVQTSSVAVDVSEVVSCGEKVTDNQSVNYGKYKIPLTLTAGSAETTDIYLDTPLAKSGNNADYIDYATQKRHNSDGTESSVTLPEISTLAGTNTLTVGTEVQPSGVEIKGHIK